MPSHERSFQGNKLMARQATIHIGTINQTKKREHNDDEYNQRYVNNLAGKKNEKYYDTK